MLIEKDLQTSTDTYYIYGLGLLSQGEVSGEDRQYYLVDGLGHIRALTDSAGVVVEHYTFDPYGNQVEEENTSTFRFKGEHEDINTGLYYMRARYYDPLTGRFTSRDPVEGDLSNPQSQNGYSYAHNDPVNLSDPSGNSVSVYGGFDPSGSIRYVGQTCQDLAARTTQHLNSLDPIKQQLNYNLLHTVPDVLTARGSEQSYIDTYGLAKNGGQLINQINSISPSNPALEQAKSQAQAAGAVPVAASVGQAIISALGSFPLILMVNPGTYDPSHRQSMQL